MGLLDVGKHALDLFVVFHSLQFKLPFVEIPFSGFHADGTGHGTKPVVVAFDGQVLMIGRLHDVVVVGIGVKSASAEFNTGFGYVALQHRCGFMSVEGFDGVGGVEVSGRILFDHHVDGTAHGRASELCRNDTFIYLDAIDQTHRDIVDVDEVRVVVHGSLVDEETDTFSLQSSDGKA